MSFDARLRPIRVTLSSDWWVALSLSYHQLTRLEALLAQRVPYVSLPLWLTQRPSLEEYQGMLLDPKVIALLKEMQGQA